MRVAVPVVLVALAIVVAGVLRGAQRAEALSCVGPETVLVGAERAFIGALVAEDGDRLTFDVTEPARGELPDPVVVRDELAGSGWPLAREVERGRSVGLVVRTVDGELVTNQCALVDPALLREARDGGWPEGAAHLGSARARVVGGRARVEVGCFGRCRGRLTLRAVDGRPLGHAPIDLRRAGTVVVRLGDEGRRRLGRRGRLPARATIRLCPGDAARSVSVTLIA
jgi:hypothetical protein